MRMLADRESSAWRPIGADLTGLRRNKKDAPEMDASFSIYELPDYQVELSQPRSSIALTTREIATI